METINPTEKALALYLDMTILTTNMFADTNVGFTALLWHETRKQLALRIVKEVLDTLSAFDPLTHYWQRVQKELEEYEYNNQYQQGGD